MAKEERSEVTKEEILAMKPGEKLDKLVILNVMGWVYPQYPNFNPSIDISAAWQVVEKVRSMEDGEGNPLLCCLTIYSDHDIVWDIRWCYSEFSNRNDGHKTHRLPTCYDDFPEAICKVALLAKRKDD